MPCKMPTVVSSSTCDGDTGFDSSDRRMQLMTEIKRALLCPIHQELLQLDPGILSVNGVPWPEVPMRCRKGCIFQVKDGIPRFVPQDTYASAFGLQWNRYQKTQLDSYTKHSYSRQRLERCLGAPLEALRGKVVLECGSGAGRFTELLLDHCELLVSLDLSAAVEANLRNCRGKRPYLLCQADLQQSPLPRQFFDVVICLGVIQHTPSPEQSISSLAEHLKPGATLIIDHYSVKSLLHRISAFFTTRCILRPILKRLEPERGLKATIAVTAICDSVRRRTSKHLWVDRIASKIFPSACYYNAYADLDPNIVYEWNELDTHDGLTNWYEHFRTREEIHRCLSRLGFENIYCTYAGNGVEARAVLANKAPLH